MSAFYIGSGDCAQALPPCFLYWVRFCPHTAAYAIEGDEMFDQLFSQLTFIDIFNVGVVVAFSVCYCYQFFFVLVVLTHKPPKQEARANHRYAVLISARNENQVIGDLVQSIRLQNYPQELIDIFVVADNCTDNTAEVARAAGATEVFVRYHKTLIGKGYALDFGYRSIQERYPNNGYEAYFFFDADNVLDMNYFREMNKVFDGGAIASTSYRNSKNYGSNWISAGYAVWFLREAKYLSQARLTLNTSCVISGTGFFISAKVLAQHGGWKWHLLTEDIEFSAQTIIDGGRISYCPTAILYDEQPTTFRDSWNQRFRWAKGFYQVFWHYAARLAKGIFVNPKGAKFACYDLLMTVSPAMLLTLISVGFNGTIAMLSATGYMSAGAAITSSISSLVFCMLNYGLFMFVFGVLTTFTEWDNIHSTTGKKIAYIFTFPFFMLTYIPIALVALVKKARWTPISHTISVDVEELGRASQRTGK